MDSSEKPPCCRGRGNAQNNVFSRPTAPDFVNSGLPAGPSVNHPKPPPPIPSRTTRQNSSYSSGYGMPYGGGFGSLYGSSIYNTGGMYGSSMYGSGMYGRTGYGGNMPLGSANFVRMAEESSRPAFEILESVVNAVGSVSMVLESTYGAVYNSFRAVIGLADHFSRLKTHFGQAFSALAIIRTLRYCYYKLLALLGLRPHSTANEIWSEVTEAAGVSVDGSPSRKQKSSWPLLIFFAFVFAAPYLIYKLLSSFAIKQEHEWASGESLHFVAVTDYDFEGENDDELSFRAGQQIRVAPKDIQPNIKGWLLASVDGSKTGIIPANYVRILGKRRGTKYQSSLPAVTSVQNSTTMNNKNDSNNEICNNSVINSNSIVSDDTFREKENEQNMDDIFDKSDIIPEEKKSD